MRSHVVHLLLYATLVAAFFALLSRRRTVDRLRLGGLIWGAMVLGTLVLAYLMYPFPD
jgi:amino acid permease